ncbi:MAG: hypothetical protein V4719_01825 [Planctomycetota bacterium]
MAGLFNTNAFSRRKSRVRQENSAAVVELLEDRIVLASQVTAAFSNGNLTLSGSGFDDNIDVSITGTNTVTVTGNSGTTIINNIGPFLVTGKLIINMGNGNDTVTINGDAGTATLTSQTVSIDLGAGDDTFTTNDNLTFSGNVSIQGGAGEDRIEVGGTGSAIGLKTLTIDAGTDTGGTPNSKLVDVHGVTSTGDVSLKSGATGANDFNIGFNAPNTVGGNLTVAQTVSGIAESNDTEFTDTSVNGNLLVTQGNSTDFNAITVFAVTTPVTIGGITYLTNGNSSDNTVNLNSSLGFALTFNKNLTVKNGNSTGYNNIYLFDVTGNGAASTFTNGTGVTNVVEFTQVVTGNHFTGTVAATNGNSSGTSFIDAYQLASDTGMTFTNGTAALYNQIHCGSDTFAAEGLAITGNLVLSNGSAPHNFVGLDNVTMSGDVTITNAPGGVNGSRINIGRLNPNAIGGNVKITNQASVGFRIIEINQTSITGRTGLSIYNLGTGNTGLNIGVNNPVTVTGGLIVQDGSGNASVTLQSLTVASLRYSDLGGGADTINLANAGGSLNVGGVTRIDTGNGSDIVSIATTGTAYFNGFVSIGLGTGDDSLSIGDNAASPAFSTANNFQLDGGAGTDAFFASPLSLADYFAGTLPGKLKSKITGFESLT